MTEHIAGFLFVFGAEALPMFKNLCLLEGAGNDFTQK